MRMCVKTGAKHNNQTDRIMMTRSVSRSTSLYDNLYTRWLAWHPQQQHVEERKRPCWVQKYPLTVRIGAVRSENWPYRTKVTKPVPWDCNLYMIRERVFTPYCWMSTLWSLNELQLDWWWLWDRVIVLGIVVIELLYIAIKIQLSYPRTYVHKSMSRPGKFSTDVHRAAISHIHLVQC